MSSQEVRSKLVTLLLKHFPWMKQFMGFSMVGVINMALSYIIYAVVISFGVHPQIANQISFWLTVLNGFLLNKTFVFKSKTDKKTKNEMVKYFGVYGFNWLLGIVLLYLYIDVLHINSYLAPIISIPLTIPMNFLISKYWVFKKKEVSYADKSESE